MHLNSPYRSKNSVKILKNIFTFEHYTSKIIRNQNNKYFPNNVEIKMYISLPRGYYRLDYISFKPKLIWQYPKKVMKSYQNSLKNTATPNQIEKSELVTFQTFLFLSLVVPVNFKKPQRISVFFIQKALMHKYVLIVR